MSWRSRLLALGLLIALGGCGFRPLYGEQAFGSVVPDLEHIEVQPMDDRIGQKMHNMLLDRLNPAGRPEQPLYALHVVNTVSRQQLGLRITEIATRAQLTMLSRFSLRRLDTGAVLYEGSTRSINSYNLVESDYANLSAEEDATNRALRENSEAIRTRLALFFDRARNQR